MEQTSKIIYMKQHNRKSSNSSEVTISESAITREEDDIMDDNKILEKYLDKVEQDRRDMEKRITENTKDSERRIKEQRKLSEERMENRFNEVMNSLEKTNKNIHETYNRVENKIDTSIKNMENKLDSSVKGMKDKLDNTYKWVIGTCIATIVGIAAMVMSVMSGK